MLMLHRRRLTEQFFSISCGFLRSQFLYSTATSSSSISKQKPHLIVDYLVDSLGFSKHAAISASSKIKVTPYLKSTENADLVVNLFKDYGLDDTQIKDIVSFEPQILRTKANKTLEPKLKFFQELGLSGPDLVKFIRRNTALIRRKALRTHIIPAINLIGQMLGSHEKIIEVLKRPRWLHGSKGVFARMPENVLLLQRYKIPNEKIKHAIVINPGMFQLSTELLEEKIHYVEEELGIPRDSSMFMGGLIVSFRCRKATIEEKMRVFKSFGWSDSELSTLLTALPSCLTYSAATICEKLNFLMKSLGYTPTVLISFPNFLSYSLEKRVKPRFRIWKILKEKEVVNDKPSLNTLLVYSELKFLQFLRCFETEIPGLSEDYVNSTSWKSKAA